MLLHFGSSSESLRYLDLHPVIPEDAPPELKDSFDALLAPLLLNSALAALRSGGLPNAQIAVRSADRALNKLELNNSDKGDSCLFKFKFPVLSHY